MKYLRFEKPDGEIAYGLVENEKVYELDKAPYEDCSKQTGNVYALDELKILSPSEPNSIFCIGTNYMDHIRETKEKLGQELPIPDHPVVFLKARNTISHHEDSIPYPHGVEKFDYEGEMGVIISKKCHRVSTEEAMEYVAGFTCANDVSARDFQFRDSQWTMGKSLDKFCPFGPVVTDEIDYNNVSVQVRINGETVQKGNTSDMIFKVPELISFISEYITLMPGDLIITGTPEGVGHMCVGDTVEVEIEGIGVLRNYIISEQ